MDTLLIFFIEDVCRLLSRSHLPQLSELHFWDCVSEGVFPPCKLIKLTVTRSGKGELVQLSSSNGKQYFCLKELVESKERIVITDVLIGFDIYLSRPHDALSLETNESLLKILNEEVYCVRIRWNNIGRQASRGSMGFALSFIKMLPRVHTFCCSDSNVHTNSPLSVVYTIRYLISTGSLRMIYISCAELNLTTLNLISADLGGSNFFALCAYRCEKAMEYDKIAHINSDFIALTDVDRRAFFVTAVDSIERCSDVAFECRNMHAI